MIVGHVDHGKSTLIGRLLFETASLPPAKIKELQQISSELGKEMELAFLMDHLKEEREKNITIDTAQIPFRSHKRDYIIIDAPGHFEFTKNMLTGASQAYAAVLLIDSREGMREQTKRHAYLLKMLGIEKLIVAINKMDIIDDQASLFETVKKETLAFLENLDLRPAAILPISAKEGLNVLKRSPRMSWFKGPTLLKALDTLERDVKEDKHPLRFPIQDIYERDQTRIIVGKVVSGTIQQGQKIKIFPSLDEAEIERIVVFGSRVKKAQQEENIGLKLSRPLDVKRGDIITDIHHPPRMTRTFEGNLFWMSEKPLSIDETVTFRCTTQKIQSVVQRIEKRMNSSTLEVIEENASRLQTHEAAQVTFKTHAPLVFDAFHFIEEMGRFAIEQDGTIQGAGTL